MKAPMMKSAGTIMEFQSSMKGRVKSHPQKHFTLNKGVVCGLAVNTSNSGSGRLGFTPRPLCCFLRQGTILHFVSLHPGVSMGTGYTLHAGSNPAMC